MTNSDNHKGWCRSYIEEEKFCHTWPIDNDRLYCNRPNGIQKSNFSIQAADGTSTWRLEAFYEFASTCYKLRVNLILQDYEKSDQVKAKVKLSFVNADRKKILSLATHGTRAFKTGSVWGTSSYSMIELAQLSLDNNPISKSNKEILIYCEIDILNRPREHLNENIFELSRSSTSILLNNSEDELKCQESSDVKLIASGREFRAHKAILSTESPVFKAMFSHNTIESKSNQVDLTLKPDVLEEMLRYMYIGTSTLEARVHNIEQRYLDNLEKEQQFLVELLQAADRYLLDNLKLDCEQVLCRTISIDTAAKLLSIADLVGANKLKKDVLEFVYTNATQVIKTDGWAQLKRELISEVVLLAIEKSNYI